MHPQQVLSIFRTQFFDLHLAKQALMMSWPSCFVLVAISLLFSSSLYFLGTIDNIYFSVMALSGALYNVIFIGGLGIGIGSGFFMSKSLGNSKPHECGLWASQGIWCSVFLGIIVNIFVQGTDVLLIILQFLQQPPFIIEHTVPFAKILFLMLPFMAGFSVLRILCFSVRQVRALLVMSFLCVLFNIILNYLFIFVLGYGAISSAWAIVISVAILSICFTLWVTYRKSWSVYCLRQYIHKISPRTAKDMLILGMSNCLSLTFEGVAFYIWIILGGLFGYVWLGAQEIGHQVLGLCFLIPLGMGQIMMLDIAKLYCDDSKKYDLVLMLRTYIILFIFIASMISLFILLFEGVLISIFLDEALEDSTNIAEKAFQIMPFIALLQIPDTIQLALAFLLRGLKKTWSIIVVCFFSLWVIGLPLAWYLGQSYKSLGTTIGMTIGLTCMLVGYSYLLYKAWPTRGEGRHKPITPVAVALK